MTEQQIDNDTNATSNHKEEVVPMEQSQVSELAVEQAAKSIVEQAPASDSDSVPQEIITDESAFAVFAVPPLGEFPKDELDTALHSDQVPTNFTERANKLIEWLNGRNSVDAITELLRAYGYADCEKWKVNLDPDAMQDTTDESVRLFLVKRALHLSFLSIQDEDITNVLMAVNAPDTGHVWFAMFERQVLPVMIRLGL